MEIKFTATGAPLAAMAEEYLKVQVAVTRGIGRAGVGLQAGLRRQTLSGGLGRKLANAWRLDLYPKGKASANAAALVTSKSPKLIDAFDRGAMIKSEAGFWLAIPTADAPKRGVGGKRINPSNFPESRYGPLRFIFRRHGPSFLVVDNLRRGKRGYLRARTKKQLIAAHSNPDATVVMFLLYPRVKLRKRLDVAREHGDWSGRLPALIEAELEAID
ncbi:DUF6441 family protein [Amaricoccus solimangrovi]|uniref:Uncharacterized protein n=1 Tax=Amaricoccus solimangrovi TaxID=2589815 RepID=A0A501WC99_9RHOB|nr:DUF6441 family protein [Amaricoccus solimangrovi]TPE47229.1 hypothetical protein FJM51_20455 [Amaricoccus solimangrovi]